jgi:hypothetical protein
VTPHEELRARIKACDALVALYDGRPVVWGQADCAILAASAIAFITGAPPLDPWPSYTDPKSALRAMRAAGFRSIPGALKAATKGARRHVLEALPGDILVAQSDVTHFPVLGVALGEGRALWPGIAVQDELCFFVGAVAGLRCWRVV